MRLLTLVALAISILVTVMGIVYVPRHDGQLADAVLLVLLPAVGACWCICRSLPQPRIRRD
jgi:hypothetical protein